jgi:hypothetical protein
LILKEGKMQFKSIGRELWHLLCCQLDLKEKYSRSHFKSTQ